MDMRKEVMERKLRFEESDQEMEIRTTNVEDHTSNGEDVNMEMCENQNFILIDATTISRWNQN